MEQILFCGCVGESPEVCLFNAWEIAEKCKLHKTSHACKTFLGYVCVHYIYTQYMHHHNIEDIKVLSVCCLFIARVGKSESRIGIGPWGLLQLLLLLSLFTSCVSGRGNRIGPVCLCVCLSVCLSALSRLNRLTCTCMIKATEVI